MRLLSECLCWCISTPAPANILLIVGDIEGHDEITRAFDLVTRKEYNCMLAQQVDSEAFHHFAVDKAWTWNPLSITPDTSSSPSQGVSALQEQVSGTG